LNFLLVLMYIIVLCFSYALFRFSGLSIVRFSIPMLFFISYLGFSYVGMMGYYFQWFEKYGVISFDRDLVEFMWILNSGCLVLITCGFVFCRHLLGMRLKTSRVWHSEREIRLFPSIFLFAVCAYIFFLYSRHLPSIPIFDVISGKGADAARIGRSYATNDFQGGRLGYYRLFFSTLLNFVSYYSIGVALKKKGYKYRLFAIVSVSFALFISVHTVSKAPLVDYVIGAVAVYLLSMKNVHVPLKKLFVFGLFFTIIFSFMTFYFYRRENMPTPVNALGYIIQRALGGQIESLYSTMEFIRNETELLDGRSFPNPRRVFPWEQIKLNREVALYRKKIMGREETKRISSAPAVFWAEIYANFGWFAALISAFLVGMFVYALQYFMANKPMSPLRVALISWTAVYIAKLARVSINMLLPTPRSLIFILLAAAFMHYMTRIRIRFGPSTQTRK